MIGRTVSVFLYRLRERMRFSRVSQALNIVAYGFTSVQEPTHRHNKTQ